MGEDVQPTKVTIEQLAQIVFATTLVLAGVSSIFCPLPFAISLFILAAASLHFARGAVVHAYLPQEARTDRVRNHRCK
jgi:hypothetical protein